MNFDTDNDNGTAFIVVSCSKKKLLGLGCEFVRARLANKETRLGNKGTRLVKQGGDFSYWDHCRSDV